MRFLGKNCFYTFGICVLILHSQVADASSSRKKKFQGDFSQLLKWEPLTFMESYESSWFQERVPAQKLEKISHLVGPKEFFANRWKNHMKAVQLLADIIIEQDSLEDVLRLAGLLRDHPQINRKLWIQAFIAAKVKRDDMQFLRFPSLIELIPDDFIPSEIFEQAASIKPQLQECIVLDGNFTNDNGIENALWYFREDLQVNSHHWLWHTYYSPMGMLGSQTRIRTDRRGELFAFMHHEFLARYATERMTAGLHKTEPLKMDKVSPIEGYASHLTDRNSQNGYADRAPNDTLKDVAVFNTPGGWYNLSVAGNADVYDLLIADINAGFLIEKNGTSVPLDGFYGIDILADTIEASIWAVNPERYSPSGFLGGFHNDGHTFAALVANPLIIGPVTFDMFGIMAATGTSMRDPIFYRFHTAAEQLFMEHKNLLTPYTPENAEFQLKWNEIRVRDIKLTPEDQGTVNELKTFWNYKEFNFTRGLDLGQLNETLSPIAICSKHLDHGAFDYEINVERPFLTSTEATVRIYLARRYDENMNRLSMEEQRGLFFNLDQFSITLTPGTNTIVRNSRNSSLTIPFESWVDLEESDIVFQNCGCGWPQHLLLPRGSSSGTSYDVFVMITPGREDNRDTSKTEGECVIAPLWCGVRDENYPSKYPMGYPFDRRPYSITDNSGATRVVANLDEYIAGIPNMATTRVRIQHLEN